MTRPWIVDMTLRPIGPPEVEVEPDGTIEVSWERLTEADASAMTLLLEPDAFRAIVERGKQLMLLGKVRSDASPTG